MAGSPLGHYVRLLSYNMRARVDDIMAGRLAWNGLWAATLKDAEVFSEQDPCVCVCGG